MSSLLFLYLLFTSCETQKVILIITEGLSGHSFHKYSSLEGFRLFDTEGVVSTKLVPVFPTHPLPNRHTLLTGVAPHKHGIISSFIYNWKSGSSFEDFTLSTDLDEQQWWNTRPLYISATKQRARVALFYFPECDVRWGTPPTLCISSKTNLSLASEGQIERLIDSTRSYDLVIVRDESVYKELEENGPDRTNEETCGSMKRMSEILQQLHSQVESRIDLNVIFMSLHGMIHVPLHNTRVIDHFLPMQMVNKTVGSGSFMQIVAKTGKTHQIYSQLKYHSPIPNVNVYFTAPKVGDLPDYYSYKLSPTVSDLVLVADPGYGISTLDEEKRWPPSSSSTLPLGLSGYNSKMKEMQGVFMGVGPIFRRGYSKGAIDVVDVYVLLCTVLKLHDCNPTTGSLRRIGDVLVNGSISLLPTSSIVLVSILRLR